MLVRRRKEIEGDLSYLDSKIEPQPLTQASSAGVWVLTSRLRAGSRLWGSGRRSQWLVISSSNGQQQAKKIWQLSFLLRFFFFPMASNNHH
jgi:hypothetical protein